MNERERMEALERTHAWWMCDNIINHPGQIALLHMGFPRLFILMRDYDTVYWAGYEQWKRDLIEVTFLDRDEHEHTSGELDELLTDAWNFLVLEEEEEERLELENEMEDEDAD